MSMFTPPPVSSDVALPTRSFTACSNLLPVGYWFWGFMLGPILCRLIGWFGHLALTRPGSLLYDKSWADVYRGLSPVKQKKWQINLVKGIGYTVGLGFVMPLAVNVFSHWCSGYPEVILWIETEFWGTYYRACGAIITSLYSYQLTFAPDMEWDVWLHHVGCISMFCLTLTQDFLPSPADAPFYPQWVILASFVLLWNFATFLGMACYHVAPPDAIWVKYRVAQLMWWQAIIIRPSINIVPLAYTITMWPYFSWVGTKWILLCAPIPNLAEQGIGILTHYKILMLNKNRLKKYNAEQKEKALHPSAEQQDGSPTELHAIPVCGPAKLDTIPSGRHIIRLPSKATRISENGALDDAPLPERTSRTSRYLQPRTSAYRHSATGASALADRPSQCRTPQLQRIRSMASARHRQQVHGERRVSQAGSERTTPVLAHTSKAAELKSGDGHAAPPERLMDRLKHTVNYVNSVVSKRVERSEEQVEDDEVVQVLNSEAVRSMLQNIVELAIGRPDLSEQQLRDAQQMAEFLGFTVVDSPPDPEYDDLTFGLRLPLQTIASNVAYGLDDDMVLGAWRPSKQDPAGTP